MRPDATRSAEQIRSLADRLAAIPSIASLTTSTHNEPSTLAHSLSDIADASEAYLDQLSRVFNPEVQGDELMGVLVELSIELQHMLYHLEDPRFLRELFAPLREEWDKQREQ